jgi:hypothetical protein
MEEKKMTKLTMKKINELIKDERAAHEEYEEIARTNLKYNKVFLGMAQEEYMHYKNLLRIKEKEKKK